MSTSSGYKREFVPQWISIFPWLYYDENLNKVFCTQCRECYVELKIAIPSSSLNDARIFESFVREGFSNWSKAQARLKSHEKSNFHRNAATSIMSRRTINVSNLLSKQLTQTRLDARHCLIKIFETIRFLAVQGLPMRGHKESQSNFIQLLHLRCHR